MNSSSLVGSPLTDNDSVVGGSGSSFNTGTRRNEDDGMVSYKDGMDKKFASYTTMNFYNDNSRQKFMKSLDNVGMSATKNRDGYGGQVDTESGLLKSVLTNDKMPQQLATRPYNVPYMGAGETHIVQPEVYSRLVSGAETRVKKATDALSGVSIDRFIPMVPCLAKNIQNTDHIIPEYWIRGGESSRAYIQNVDYFKMCGIQR
jgi:hypothetical protein